MAASRRSATASKPRKRPTTASKPRARRKPVPAARPELVAAPVPVAPAESVTPDTLIENAEQQTPAAAEPILLLGRHPNGPEVLVVDPEDIVPHPPAAARISSYAIRCVAWGASVALMVATIMGGLELGHTLKTRVNATKTIEEAAPEAGLTESAPPRRGVEWAPPISTTGVDPAPRTIVRQAAALPPAPADAQPTSVWPRLTALMGEGIRLHREGWYGPATARFREAVAVMPDYLRAYLWLGRSGLKAGRYDEAKRALEQVIALDPESTAAQEAKSLLLQIEKAN